MYQENNESINWIKIFLRIIIAFLILILSIKLISIIVSNREFSKKNASMEDNLKVLDKIAKEYFVNDKLPKNVGDSIKIVLDDLIDDKLSDDLVDSDGKKCDYKESFIKATRLETEYQIQSSLTCGTESDYINSFIKIDEDIIIKPTSTTKKPTSTTTKTTTTTTTTSKSNITTTKNLTTTGIKTTKKTTVAKKYTISFNSNGGSYISNQLIKSGSKATSYTPYRKGYKFLGWYYHGDKFDFNTKIKKDYVLTAKWVKE